MNCRATWTNHFFLAKSQFPHLSEGGRVITVNLLSLHRTPGTGRPGLMVLRFIALADIVFFTD